jgi:hypothetical protein
MAFHSVGAKALCEVRLRPAGAKGAIRARRRPVVRREELAMAIRLTTGTLRLGAALVAVSAAHGAFAQTPEKDTLVIAQGVDIESLESDPSTSAGPASS